MFGLRAFYNKRVLKVESPPWKNKKIREAFTMSSHTKLLL